MRVNISDCPRCGGVTMTELRFLARFCAFCGIAVVYRDEALKRHAEAVKQAERQGA